MGANQTIPGTFLKIPLKVKHLSPTYCPHSRLVSRPPLSRSIFPAEVVCIIEFSSPGPGPCGYQVVLIFPFMLVYPTMLYTWRVCTSRYARAHTNPALWQQIPRVRLWNQCLSSLHSRRIRLFIGDRAKRLTENGRKFWVSCSNAPDQGYRHGDIWRYGVSSWVLDFGDGLSGDLGCHGGWERPNFNCTKTSLPYRDEVSRTQQWADRCIRAEFHIS